MTLNNDRETNQTDKQINRLTGTDRQTDRQTDRHTEREREREREREQKTKRKTDKLLKVGPRSKYHTNDRLDKKIL